MLISQLARETALPVATVRYYEKMGLIRSRKPPAGHSNNYGSYDEEALERLLLIKEARETGFTLAEIKSLIEAWFSNRLSMEKKTAILHAKRAEIDNKIAHLKQMKRLIERAVKDIEAGNC